jgi:hypothetical protein
VRANSDDRVVVDEVPIGGRRVLESGVQDHCRAQLFLLLSRVLKIAVMRRSSYSNCRRVPL